MECLKTFLGVVSSGNICLMKLITPEQMEIHWAEDPTSEDLQQIEGWINQYPELFESTKGDLN